MTTLIIEYAENINKISVGYKQTLNYAAFYFNICYIRDLVKAKIPIFQSNYFKK